MFTIVLGNEYFAKKVIKNLKKINFKRRYVFLDTSNSRMDAIAFMMLLPFSSSIYSLSAAIAPGGALKLALLFKKKIFQHFIGSDVLTSKEDYKRGLVSKKLIQNSVYFCEVDWIQDELLEMGISAKVLPICAYSPSINSSFSFSQKPLEVLTYVGEGREKFYNLDMYLRLAKVFKNVNFTIVGTSYKSEEKLSNLKILGWVENFEELLVRSHVYMRFVEHDGLSFSVIEALSHEKWVLYNNRLKGCLFVENINDVQLRLSEICEALDKGDFKRNEAGKEFVKNNYEEKRIFENLSNALFYEV